LIDFSTDTRERESEMGEPIEKEITHIIGERKERKRQEEFKKGKATIKALNVLPGEKPATLPIDIHHKAKVPFVMIMVGYFLIKY
jgi:hypothetical protein